MSDHDLNDRLSSPFISFDQLDALKQAGLSPKQTFAVILAATRCGETNRQTGEKLPPGEAYVSQEWISQKLGIDHHTVGTGLRLAEKAGLVTLVAKHIPRARLASRWDFTELLKRHKGKKVEQEPANDAADDFCGFPDQEVA